MDELAQAHVTWHHLVPDRSRLLNMEQICVIVGSDVIHTMYTARQLRNNKTILERNLSLNNFDNKCLISSVCQAGKRQETGYRSALKRRLRFPPQLLIYREIIPYILESNVGLFLSRVCNWRIIEIVHERCETDMSSGRPVCPRCRIPLLHLYHASGYRGREDAIAMQPRICRLTE